MRCQARGAPGDPPPVRLLEPPRVIAFPVSCLAPAIEYVSAARGAACGALAFDLSRTLPQLAAHGQKSRCLTHKNCVAYLC
jgi:hypothetical protein